MADVGSRLSARETADTKEHSSSNDESFCDNSCLVADGLTDADGLAGSINVSTSTKRIDLTVAPTCTACQHKINISRPEASLHKHPVLRVLVCKSCYKYYTSGKIDQGSDGMDEQCRWCGQGGRLVLCDFCHNAFCKDCVRQNLGRKELTSITAENSKWHCYVCDPAPLRDLITYCAELQDAIKQRSCGNRSSNKASEVDTDSSSCMGTNRFQSQSGSCCFVTAEDVDSVLDELVTRTKRWTCDLAALSSESKRLKSSNSKAAKYSKKVEFANKVSHQISCYYDFLTKLVVKRSRSLGKDGKRKTGKNMNMENGIAVLDVSGSDAEDEPTAVSERGDPDTKNGDSFSQGGDSAAVKPLGVMEDVGEWESRDGGVEEVETEDLENAEEEEQFEGMEVDGGSGSLIPGQLSAPEEAFAQPKIKLTISIPKMTAADIEAQRQLHREGMNSEEEEDQDEEEEEEKKGNEDDEDKSSASEEEEEQIDSEASSEEEYNPKQDMRDMKSAIRKERRERAKKTKTRAAKRSLQKIRDAVQKKKLKEEEEKKKEKEIKRKKKKVPTATLR